MKTATLAALLAVILSTGCRTGIRRVTSAIEGQGTTTIDLKLTEGESPETAFSYLTSENSSINGRGWRVYYDPARKIFDIEIDEVSIVRTPSENQDTFAGQLAQGRAADTEALSAYAEITKAGVAGAVEAAVSAALPAYVARQGAKTERAGIRAGRDVELARIGAEGHEGGEAAPAE